MRVDAGVGSWDAEEGSPEWAKRLRLAWLSTKHDLRSAPERFAAFYRKAVETRAWTLMLDDNGKAFPTFDAFCCAPEPWGFGQPWSEIRPFLLGVIPERELDLMTVAPAKAPVAPSPGPGRGKKNLEVKHGALNAPGFIGAGSRSEKQLRAIAERAPEPARALYRAGLLGQKEAAKLGPKNPTPEDAARVTSIALELAADARAIDASTEALRKQAQRALNVRARQLLGVQTDKVTELLRAVERLADEDRARLADAGRARGWWS